MIGLDSRSTVRSAFAVLALVSAAGCGGAAATQAGTPGGPSPAPSTDANAGRDTALAAALIRATLPPSARQAQFGWELDEAGAKFRGRGVARYRAPDRFRLDLFGPRGETYLAAALVDEEPRVPAAVTERFALPSPALLWAAVGVVRPPAGAVLQGAAQSGGGDLVLRYSMADQGTLEYRARGGRLQSVRRLRGGGVQESVDLTYSDAGALQRAQYRDWIAFRTLTLTLESSTDVAQFPEETWSPPGTGR